MPNATALEIQLKVSAARQAHQIRQGMDLRVTQTQNSN